MKKSATLIILTVAFWVISSPSAFAGYFVSGTQLFSENNGSTQLVTGTSMPLAWALPSPSEDLVVLATTNNDIFFFYPATRKLAAIGVRFYDAYTPIAFSEKFVSICTSTNGKPTIKVFNKKNGALVNLPKKHSCSASAWVADDSLRVLSFDGQSLTEFNLGKKTAELLSEGEELFYLAGYSAIVNIQNELGNETTFTKGAETEKIATVYTPFCLSRTLAVQKRAGGFFAILETPKGLQKIKSSPGNIVGFSGDCRFLFAAKDIGVAKVDIVKSDSVSVKLP